MRYRMQQQNPSVDQQARPATLADMKQHTSKDVAEHLGITQKSVERSLRNEKIKGFKLFGKWYVTEETFQEIKEGKVTDDL